MERLILLILVWKCLAYKFDYEEFYRKHCYHSSDEKSTYYYFPYFLQGRTWKFHDGVVCENFVLSENDLDYMAKNEFAISNYDNIFLRNCEIYYFNEYLISKFPETGAIHIDNCTISLRNPKVKENVKINSTYIVAFHNCKINDNLKSHAFQKLWKLVDIIIQNSTLQYPVLEE